MEDSEEAMQIQRAKDAFAVKMGHMVISADSIILALKCAMEVVELTTLSGTKKKAAVIEMVRQAVVDAAMDEHTEAILLEIINDGVMSHTIDVIVSATRGELSLSGVMKRAFQPKCVSLLLACFAKCVPHTDK